MVDMPENQPKPNQFLKFRVKSEIIIQIEFEPCWQDLD